MVDFFKKRNDEKLEIRDQKIAYRPRYSITRDEKMIIDVLFYNFVKRPKKPYTTKKELIKKTKLQDLDSQLENLIRKGAVNSLEYSQLPDKFKKKYKKESEVYYVEDIIEKSDEEDLRKFRYTEEYQ